MSYFAIHVKTGYEQVTVEQLQKQIKNTLFEEISSVIAPVVQIKKFVSKDTVILKRKLVASSYIYIKLAAENIFEIPGKIYHFLKNIGGVLKILPYSIPKEEIEAFCFNYDLALEEAEIEIKLDQVTQSTDSLQATKEQMIHEANLNLKGEEQETVIRHALSLERMIDRVNDLIQKGKRINHRLLMKCKAYIHSNRETFRFPLALFLKTRNRIDPNQNLTNKQLTTHSFILPELIKTLELELSSWKN
ncbi:MAG: transcription termination/antitermination NusG family protein [Bacillota bacterium]|nr:transcription termination/antitermination NusG family protein [Bacillota bacterium]